MPTYKDQKTGKWYCQFWAKDWTGKNRHITKRGFDKKKDAEKYEREMKRQLLPEKISMQRLIDEFRQELDTRVRLGSIKESSAFTTKERIRFYIQDYFKHIDDASLVRTKDINKWLGEISVCRHESPTYKNGKPVKTKRGSNTIRGAKIVLRQIFAFAVKNYGFADNPVEKAEPIVPYTNDSREKLWTLEQYAKFYEHLGNDTHKVFFNVLYWAGLRIGEALALTPADIVPYKIHVNKGMAKVDIGSVKIDTPKTRSSVRTVEIPRFLFFQLQDYISRLYLVQPTDRIFVLSDHYMRTVLRNTSAKAGLPHISPHILRHSYASLLYNTTKDALIVSKQIGHKDASLTLKVYSHMMPNEDRSAIDNLEALVLAPKEPD